MTNYEKFIQLALPNFTETYCKFSVPESICILPDVLKSCKVNNMRL